MPDRIQVEISSWHQEDDLARDVGLKIDIKVMCLGQALVSCYSP